MKKSLTLLLLTSATLVGGELPELFDKPWVAWYAGYEGKTFNFGVGPDGDASLIPIDDKKDAPFSQHGFISIKPVVLETKDGRDVVKQPLEDGWEALTPESAEAEKVHFRGTVTGGAKYEVLFEIDGDEVHASGHIIDKGELTENPIRFAIRVTVPDFHRRPKDEESLLDKAKDDRFDFVMVNKKKAKIKGDEIEEEVAEECKAIRSVRVDAEYYKGARFEADAGDIGSFEIEKPGKNLIAQGFTLVWTPDPGKNAGGKGKMVMKYK